MCLKVECWALCEAHREQERTWNRPDAEAEGARQMKCRLPPPSPWKPAVLLALGSWVWKAKPPLEGAGQ